MTGGVAPGWYPDYDAPPGHRRYWDGERWTERRAAGTESEPPEPPRRRTPWVVVALAVPAVVVLVVALLATRDDGPETAGTAPPMASTPRPPEAAASDGEEQEQRSWRVVEVVDGLTLALANDARVRLLGLAENCSEPGLAALVEGQQVTLTRRGPDKAADGALLRYVERGDLDVGLRLLQRGWATASDQPHARAASYRRVDARTPDGCTGS